jgi:hypothetical protein
MECLRLRREMYDLSLGCLGMSRRWPRIFQVKLRWYRWLCRGRIMDEVQSIFSSHWRTVTADLPKVVKRVGIQYRSV